MKRLVRVTSGFVLVLILIMALSVLAIDRYGSVDRAQTADVIIVLGYALGPGGQPYPSLVHRADHGAALHREGMAPFVLCSGGIVRYSPSEASVACSIAETQGVPAGAIVREDRSHSTEENARYSAEILRQHGWHSAVLVSDGYHLYRSTIMFERAGVTVYPSPAQVTTGPMGPTERFVAEVREVLALAWYWIKTFLGLP